jgi:hypothetical protein
VQLAARQRRLQHVAGVHRAFGLAGADHGMDLVDEDDGHAFVLGQFFQDGLQAFLEFAAELGAGQQGRHVEREHAFALERIGHFAVDDALGQAFDDRGLAHARLADQDRVVLGAPLQHLDRAADLVVAADHRVELAHAGALGQIERVFLERFALAFGILRIHRFAAAHGGNRRFERLFGQAVLARQATGIGFIVQQRQQHDFAGQEPIAALLRLAIGQVQQADQFAPDLHVAAIARDFRQALEGAAQRVLQAAHVDAGALQQRTRAAIVLVQQA